MPFRSRKPWRFQWLVLPVYTVLSLIMIGWWIYFAFDAAGGWHKSTFVQKLLIFGFAGTPIFVILGTCVITVILQTAAYANHAALMAQLQAMRGSAADPNGRTDERKEHV